MVEKAHAENEVNTLLQRRVAELEAANAQMRSELDHSSETLTTLQSKFKEKDKMCEHLRNVAMWRFAMRRMKLGTTSRLYKRNLQK
jgi:hypothetical protein